MTNKQTVPSAPNLSDECRKAFEALPEHASTILFKRGGTAFAEDVPESKYVDNDIQANWEFWQKAWNAALLRQQDVSLRAVRDAALEEAANKAAEWNSDIAYDIRALKSEQAAPAQQPASVTLTDLLPEEPTDEIQFAAANAIRFDTTPLNKMWTGNAVYRAIREVLIAAHQQKQKGGG